MITAPYNFVPLSSTVIKPHWIDFISYDIPFAESESGELDITIKAESPIYVRNGASKSSEDNEKNSFNNYKGKYFIPGSSIKGMLRSMVEIMSFGHMDGRVNDHKYSVRDFQNNILYDKIRISQDACCGWLYKNENGYSLHKCGKPGRISHEALDAEFKIGLSSHYRNRQNLQNDSQKSAKSKYDLFEFPKDNKRFTEARRDFNRVIYGFDPKGKSGTIVMTGQPSVREMNQRTQKWSGKHLEFIFFDTDFVTNSIILNEDVVSNFFFSMYDHDLAQQQEDWKWRKRDLDGGKKIPVFYREKNNQIIDLGLTSLYKITYNNSICDLINKHQTTRGFDLADAIFGYTGKEIALKGRVHIEHAFVKNSVIQLPQVNEVLASPKASYYPNYIENSPSMQGIVSGNYSTLMNDNAVIRGWKKYPVHKAKPSVNTVISSAKISTSFCPLPAGTEFQFKIRYHNLRKEELGALLSAITFHNTDGPFHSIGSGKPLGYGKVKLSLSGCSNLVDYLKSFELYMNYELKKVKQVWHQTPQMKELIAMATPGDDSMLKYMQISSGTPTFTSAKKDREALLNYSTISQNTTVVNSLVLDHDLKKIQEFYHNEIKELNKTQNLDGLKNSIIIDTKTSFKFEFEKKKQELILALIERKNKILNDEMLEIQRLKDEVATSSQNALLATGFTIPLNFNYDDKKAFDNLGKLIVDYACKINKCNETNLKKSFSEGPYVAPSDIPVIVEAINAIFIKTKSKSDKNKILDTSPDSGHKLKKIVLWIGKKQADILVSDLKKL
ncbi:MAG: TIGR03986 family CRISPR-associated RAMP protein [Chitinophagaceae bacterium]|nr:TIGR03986 family CRISPR-associated RAMP protein [Chitinophagaceae bacterium]